MHLALGYQYPSHMLQLILVVAFCHLRLSLKETTPLSLLFPPPLLSPPKTKTNKHKNYKSKKAIFLLAFWWWLGRGVGKYSLWRFNCKMMCFFFFFFFNQLHLNIKQQKDQVSISFFTHKKTKTCI